MTRVVRRSEENPSADRINTSEFFEQVFQVPDKVEPKVSFRPGTASHTTAFALCALAIFCL